MNSSSTLLSAAFSVRNFHSTHIRYEKLASKIGARKWSQFIILVSVARVLGFSLDNKYIDNALTYP